jgi:transcriptional regulator of acetoin/glycerol metabolism
MRYGTEMVGVSGTLSLGEDSLDEEARGGELGLCLVLSGDQPLTPPACWPLPQVDEVVIGRGDTAAAKLDGRRLEITIHDRHVSTSHVRLRRSPGGWAIEDAGSKNGTLLNGARCVRAELSDGDQIVLGSTFLRFTKLPDHMAAAPAFATFTPSVHAVHARLSALARSDVPVLLLGESGVGKELAARTVHELSGRTGAFVGVNCAALPPTLLEATLFGHRRGAFTGAVDNRPGFIRSAHGGTLFLDEIGELSATGQAALLRVLQEREVIAVGDTEPIPVNARIVAATNRELTDEIAAGRFRNDLFARLAGLTVRLVPLRERSADLGLLIASLLRRLAPATNAVRIAGPAARALLDHDWPNNVRELEMCLRAAGELAGWGKIALRHLPEPIAAARAADPQRDQLVALLEAHQGNLAAVARELKTSRMQVHRLLKRCGLGPSTFRG